MLSLQQEDILVRKVSLQGGARTEPVEISAWKKKKNGIAFLLFRIWNADLRLKVVKLTRKATIQNTKASIIC